MLWGKAKCCGVGQSIVLIHLKFSIYQVHAKSEFWDPKALQV